MKLGGTLSTELMSLLAGSAKVSHLDVSAMTMGGNSYLADLRDGTLAGTFDHKEGSAVGDWWKWPNVAGKDFTWNGNLLLPAIAGTGLSGILWSGDPGDLEIAFAITIHGTSFVIPMTMTDGNHVFSDKELQVYEVSLSGCSPDSGAYPTAPTTTGTLLTSCMNAPNSSLAFTLTSHASEGVTYGGNMIPSSFSVGVKDADLTNVSYEFATRGVVTAIPN